MKTNIQLVEFAKKALSEKWGYVWGTFGQVLDNNLLAAKCKQYPDNVKIYEYFIRTNYLNKRVADCVGLIKAALWWGQSNPIYTPAQDVSADGMYSIAKEKGSISSIPEIPGICVYKTGHIGVYIGGGQVIESHGTMYGVMQTPLFGAGSTPWRYWLKCPFIEYTEDHPLTFQDAVKIIAEKTGISYTYWITKASIDPHFAEFCKKIVPHLK